MMLKKDDIARELSDRSGYHIKDIKKMLTAFEGMFSECLGNASLEENVEIYLSKGLIIGARVVPEHAGKDPRNQNDIIVPARVIPYAKFSQTFKEKINK